MITDSTSNDDALEVVYCHRDIERELTNPTTTTATATSSKEDANASPSSSKSLGYFSKKNIVLAIVCGIGIGGAAVVAGLSGAAARQYKSKRGKTPQVKVERIRVRRTSQNQETRIFRGIALVSTQRTEVRRPFIYVAVMRLAT